MDYKTENGKLSISLEGRIDTNNAPEIEKELLQILSENPGNELCIDAEKLAYISSAGLRVMMKLRKKSGASFKVINVSPEVYEIFDTTGFNELLDVEKRLREVSIEGCEKIGEGGNGKVYRLDAETIVKVYQGIRNNPEKIRQNRVTTKDVFLHDIPTSIAFDMVKVGENYGVVYEMIDAKSLTEVLMEQPGELEHYAEKIADMLLKLHHTSFEEGDLPDAREPLRADIRILKELGYYSEEEAERLFQLVDDIPKRNTFIHMDFHPGNLMVQDGELTLIDVEDAGLGHPVIDLSGMHLVYVTAAKLGWTSSHGGLGEKEFSAMWDIIVKRYFGTSDEKELAEINRVLEGYSMMKIIRGIATSPQIPDEIRKGAVAQYKTKLFDEVDSLYPIPS